MTTAERIGAHLKRLDADEFDAMQKYLAALGDLESICAAGLDAGYEEVRFACRKATDLGLQLEQASRIGEAVRCAYVETGHLDALTGKVIQ
jgi:hypothetical protein